MFDLLPEPARPWVLSHVVRRVRRVRWVSLRRTRPFSDIYGMDRGLPIDRVYIEDFLGRHAADVHGEVLEVQTPAYTRRFGGDRVTGSTVLDLSATNVHATLVADLCEPGVLPTGAYDCVIFTQTLHLLHDIPTALANLWAAMRPGGILLVTAPALSRVDYDDPDYWRWTPSGLERMLRATLPEAAAIDLTLYGNAIAGAAHLVGLSAEDVGVERIRAVDANFPVIMGARIVHP